MPADHSQPAGVCCDVGDVLFYDFPVKLAFSWYFQQEVLRLDGPTFDPWDIIDVDGHWRGALAVLPRSVWRETNDRAWQRVLSRWDDLIHPIPGARTALATIACPVVLLANQPKEAFTVLETGGWTKLVDDVLLDSLVGIAKPDARIFQEAVRRLGTTPSETMMIGDRLDNDIVPARREGLQAALIAPLPYDPQVVIQDVLEEWRRSYEAGRRVRLARVAKELASLPTSHRPTVCATSLAALIGQWS